MEETCRYQEAEYAEYIHIYIARARYNDGNRMESERECKARPRLTAETSERACRKLPVDIKSFPEASHGGAAMRTNLRDKVARL